MADLFISYAHRDKAYADGRGLEGVLKKYAPEISFWRDDRISAGSEWNDEIRSNLSDARCVVVIWSENSWSSQWVRQEAFYGYMRGMLVPMGIDAVKLDAPFNAVQCVDNIGGGNVKGLEALIAGIRKKLSEAR